MNIRTSLIFLFSLLLFTALYAGSQGTADEPPVSEDSQACIDCHNMVTPGIVRDWQTSRHSKNTLSTALGKDELSRRVSITKPPENIADSVAIGCAECHMLNPDNHTDNFEHFGYAINVVVSPTDCKTCHPAEVDEYHDTKKAFAYSNLKSNPVFNLLVETSTSTYDYSEGTFSSHITGHSQNETCLACHGTDVKVAGMKTIESDLGEIEVPNLTNWPNMGVGRLNPDGSKGACTSCHPRHSFDIAIARSPYTCGQCHLEPDVPAFNVYKESKHGNIFTVKHKEWDMKAVPWKVGIDFTAPTCATCHTSLVTDGDGTVIAERSHDFGSRVWVRIFGLIYSHPQTKSGNTSIIKNDDGLPLPTTFTNGKASAFLIDEKEQTARKEKMTNVCGSCHGSTWIDGHFEKFDKTIASTDSMTLAATKVMLDVWRDKIENNENPFDEPLELKWVNQWLFYANSIRSASAMIGPDYATFKNGWWQIVKNLKDIEDYYQLKKGNKTE